MTYGNMLCVFFPFRTQKNIFFDLAGVQQHIEVEKFHQSSQNHLEYMDLCIECFYEKNACLFS